MLHNIHLTRLLAGCITLILTASTPILSISLPAYDLKKNRVTNPNSHAHRLISPGSQKATQEISPAAVTRFTHYMNRTSNRDVPDTLVHAAEFSAQFIMDTGDAMMVVYQVVTDGYLTGVNVPVYEWGVGGGQQLTLSLHLLNGSASSTADTANWDIVNSGYPQDGSGGAYPQDIVDMNGWIGGYDMDAVGGMSITGTTYSPGGTVGICDPWTSVYEFAADPLGDYLGTGPAGYPLSGLIWPDGLTASTLDPTNNPDVINGGGDNWINLADFGTEPFVAQGSWIGILVQSTGEDWAETTGFYYADAGPLGLDDPWVGLKFYNGCGGTSGNGGWHIRHWVFDFELAVEYTGDRAPIFESFTILTTTTDTGPQTVTATITDDNPGGGAAGVAGATLFYSIDSTTYLPVTMTNTGGDDYSAEIPGQEPGTTISYYLTAVDVNGNESVTMVYSYNIFSTENTALCIFNTSFGDEWLVSTYFSGTTIQYDTWMVSDAGQPSLATLNNYSNIIEITSPWPQLINNDIIRAWLSEPGQKNYILVGDEWLGSQTGWVNQTYVPGDFQYDILGIEADFNDVNYLGGPDDTFLMSRMEAVAGDPIAGQLHDFLTTNGYYLNYDPWFELGYYNWMDGVTPIPGVGTAFQTYEGTVMNGGDPDPGTPLYDCGIYYQHPDGNRIVFLAFDPLSVNAYDSANNYQSWIGTEPIGPLAAAIDWVMEITTQSIWVTPPDTLDFGIVYPGIPAIDSVLIRNIGDDTLEISAITSNSADFVIQNTITDTIELNGGESYTVYISIDPPTAPESYSGTLTIASNDPDSPIYTVEMTAESNLPPLLIVTPDSLWADLYTGETETQTLTLDNSGGASDLVFDITLEEIPGRDMSGSSIRVREIGPGKLQTSEEPRSWRTTTIPSGAMNNLGEPVGEPIVRPGARDLRFEDLDTLANTPVELTCISYDPETNRIYGQEDHGYGFYAYDPLSDTWISLASCPIYSGNNGNAAVLNGKIYTTYVGNCNDGSCVMGVYDITADSWSTMWPPDEAGHIAAAGDYLYVAQEWSLYRYDPASDSWTTLPDPPVYLEHGWGGLSEYDGSLYAARGDGATDFCRYQVATAAWEILPSAPDGVVMGMDIDPAAEVVYCSGNYGGDAVYMYSIAEETWTTDWLDGFSFWDGGIVYGTNPTGIYVIEGQGGTQMVRINTESRTDWLSLDQYDGIIPAGGSLVLEVMFDATGMYGGEYDAHINIASNDPVNPIVTVPAHLTVTGAPNIVISTDILDYDTVFVDFGSLDSILVSNSGTDVLTIYSITSNNPDYSVPGSTTFTIDPEGDETVIIDFTPSAVGLSLGVLSIESDDPDQPVLNVVLMGYGVLPPVLAVTPDSLSANLFTGETETQTLSLDNSAGGSNLYYSIAIQDLPETGRTHVLGREIPIGKYQSLNRRSMDFDTDKSERTSRKRIPGIPTKIGFYADLTRTPSNRQLPFPGTPGYSGSRDLGEVLGSYDPFIIGCTGMVWVGDDLYAISYPEDALYRYDITTETILETYYIHNGPYGITWDGEYLWIGDPSGNIFGYDLTGNSIGSFSGPIWDFLTLTWDGEYFIISQAWEWNPDIYLMDHSGTVMTTYTTSINGTLDQTVWVPGHEDGHLWGYSYDQTRFIQINLQDGMGVQVNEFTFSDDDWSYAIAHDNTDLWYSDWDGPLYQIDDGIQETGDWLAVDPDNGMIPAGSSTDLAVTFDAEGLYGGLYEAQILISSNDPANPQLIIPAQLTVTGAPDIAVSNDTLDFDTVFVNYGSVDSIVVFNNGTDVLNISSIATDNSDYSVVGAASITLEPETSQMVTVSFIPTVVGLSTGILTFTSDDPDQPELTVALIGQGILPPVLVVTPDSLWADLLTGETETQTLTLDNSGGASDLVFDITLEELEGRSLPESAVRAREVRPGKLPATAEIRSSTATIIPSDACNNHGDPVGGYIARTGNRDARFEDLDTLASTPVELTCISYDPETNRIYGQENQGYGFYSYDPLSDSWNSLNSSPIYSGNNGNGAVLDGKVYTTYVGNFDSELGIYDIAADSWTTAWLPLPAGHIASAGDYIYVAQANSLYRYDPDSEVWDPLPDSPVYLEDGWGGLSEHDGYLYAARGDGATDFCRYHVATATWEILPSAPDGVVMGMDIDPAAEVVYCSGDYGGDAVYMYSIAEGTWTTDWLDGFSFWDGGIVYGTNPTGIYVIEGQGGTQMVRINTEPRTDWLSLDQYTGIIPAGSSLALEVMFDATGMYGGEYDARINIASNDPVNSTVPVPAHLSVTGAPDIFVTPLEIDFGLVYVGYGDEQSLTIENVGTEVLIISAMSIDNADFSVVGATAFSIGPESSDDIILSYLPATPGLSNGTLTITSDDADQPILDVSLIGQGILPPVVVFTPETISDTLYSGETATHILTVDNTGGGSDLVFDITASSGGRHLSRTVGRYLNQDLVKGRNNLDRYLFQPDKTDFGSGNWTSGTPAEILEIGKGESDPRIYPDTGRDEGGPDAFGYYWRDSNEPGGPVFDWISAAGGTMLYLSDDDFESGIPLGFTFTYYGEGFTSIGIGSNGWMSFNGYDGWYPSNVPYMDSYEGAIAPMARDLYPPSAGYIGYITTGTAPHRQFVVEYNNIPNYGGGNYKTFEVVFYEGSNSIRFQYLEAPDDPYGFGIESPDESMGLGNSGSGDTFINPALVENNYAIEFGTSLTTWLTVSPEAGTVPAGSSMAVEIMMDANDIDPGVYTAQLDLTTNDPENLMTIIPVSMTVLAEPTVPTPFDLLWPLDGTNVTINASNISASVIFAWDASMDADGTEVRYGLIGMGELYPLTTLGLSEITYDFANQMIVDSLGLYGMSGTSDGGWTVYAASGGDTTYAANGPFTLSIDASYYLETSQTGTLPAEFALHQNYPNPFNPLTEIRYDLPIESQVRIVIYDIRGRKVKTLVNRVVEPGYKSVVWNGVNDFGQSVSAGMYLCRIDAGNYSSVKKMLLLK